MSRTARPADAPQAPTRGRFQGPIDALAGRPKVLGAAVVTRDGLAVASRLPPALQTDVFVAMNATLIAAAESALEPLAGRSALRAVVTSDRHSLVVAGAGDDLLVVALLEGAPDAGLVAAVDQTAEAVRMAAG